MVSERGASRISAWNVYSKHTLMVQSQQRGKRFWRGKADDLKAGQEDKGGVSLVVDVAIAFEKVQLVVTQEWEWAMNVGFPQRVLEHFMRGLRPSKKRDLKTTSQIPCRRSLRFRRDRNGRSYC